MSRLTCEEAMRQFFAYLDRALSGEASESMEAHLDECLSCCDRLAFSRQLDAFVKGRLVADGAPAELERRIRTGLAAAASPGGPDGGGEPRADRVLDGGARACGELLIALKVELDGMRPGEVLQLISHDPGARVDLPIWCRMTRHRLIWNDDSTYYIARRDR
jgi:tRNA 2-thiouridine synthesizing protein A